jgi:thiol-disulfide isomerase/thioredoxin
MQPTRRAVLALGLGAGAEASFSASSSAPAHEWRPWPAGRAVPALQLPGLDGTAWRLDAQRGRTVLLNFWATWCEPCRAELPSLLQLAARHADAGLVLMAVNHRENAAAVRRYLDAERLALPVLLDADGSATRAFTPSILPSTVLVRRNGRPAGVLVGEIDWLGDEAARLLAPVLAR